MTYEHDRESGYNGLGFTLIVLGIIVVFIGFILIAFSSILPAYTQVTQPQQTPQGQPGGGVVIIAPIPIVLTGRYAEIATIAFIVFTFLIFLAIFYWFLRMSRAPVEVVT